MPKFKIIYNEPLTGLEKVVLAQFEDWEGWGVCNGIMTSMPPVVITGEMQAEDYGYHLAEGGDFTVEELSV